ncbi:tRNA(fMet)-specific endonuclease VapC [Sphingobium sp. AntQ-1]|uniref:type II toxin-antitoxin system VapC family toxin n=1 Tax=Sphingobium sp. AntQ-1 TaxID=2930091 RepID=UPI00234ED7F1|nr:type II toxin-antitoxin system VapC family toxin [Sphingobium sp. AntQ-1]WCP11984.1 tRNA(fMet)-specific endonuclease VapC [Sphingobium sp. AntQ-1]
MTFSLDANTIIALFKGNKQIWKNLERHSTLDCVVSSIVMHELYFGAFNSARVKENLDRIGALRFEVVDFARADSRTAGEVRTNLARIGKPIGPLDTLIAGQALARGFTVITRNIREFSRVEGLSFENWED